MSILDWFFIILPIIIFLIHAIWGSKMYIFGHDDGLTPGLVFIGIIYLFGLILIRDEIRILGYPLMLISFSVRPGIHLLCQYITNKYHKKHEKKVPFPEFVE